MHKGLCPMTYAQASHIVGQALQGTAKTKKPDPGTGLHCVAMQLKGRFRTRLSASFANGSCDLSALASALWLRG